MKKSLFALLAAAAFTFTYCGGDDSGHDGHWSYKGETGPEQWDELSADYEACGTGTVQSPIDITGAVEDADLPDLELNYNDSAVEILNNGHTIQANFKDGGTLKVGEDTYKLLQVHFHTPSEEAVNGDRADAVAHLVHKSDAGELAVIGVLMNKGAANAAVSKIWEVMPKEEKTVSVDFTLSGKELTGDQSGYYTFPGSLTTPPCSEGVRWFVLTNQPSIGADQIAAFQELFPMNARPLQPVNDREIKVKK